MSSSDAFSSAVTRNLMTCVLLFGVSWRWVVLGFALTFVLFIEPPVVSDSFSVKLCKHDTPFFRTNGAKSEQGLGQARPNKITSKMQMH